MKHVGVRSDPKDIASQEQLDWAGITGKPAVIAEGANAAEARSAIGAGTSSFSGSYADLSGKPTLGTAAATDTTAYAPIAHVGSGGAAHANVVAAGAAGFMTGADKTKLDGIAAGATANATDAQLRDRNTHTGSQAISTVTGLQGELDARILTAARGAANGVAALDATGKVPESQLPAVVISDVFTVATQAAMLALTAERGDIAVRSDLNKTFALSAAPASTLANWVELRSPTDVVQSVAGKTGVVTLTSADVGLPLVNNTSDASKPVSTAQAAAIATATAIHPFLLIGA